MREEFQMNAGCTGRIFNVQGMYNFVEGAISGAEMEESMRALEYMRQAHAGLERKDGQPYIVHPLGMASYALSLKSKYITDSTIATILLHDVPEEKGMLVEELPFSDAVIRGVKYMTIAEFPNETKYETKRRYAWELLECFDSVICKGLDMHNNFRTMPGSFKPDKIRKNVVEADLLRLPVLKEASNKWPNARSLLYVIRENVKSLVDAYAMIYGVRLTDPNFVNAPEAKDYSYLLTEEKSVK